MERLAAEYLYTLDRPGPVRNGFIEYDSDGTVTATGECDPSKEKVFFKGALVPGFVNSHCHEIGRAHV